jgi:hypothetical protein
MDFITRSYTEEAGKLQEDGPELVISAQTIDDVRETFVPFSKLYNCPVLFITRQLSSPPTVK